MLESSTLQVPFNAFVPLCIAVSSNGLSPTFILVKAGANLFPINNLGALEYGEVAF